MKAYDVPVSLQLRIENDYTYHAPTEEQKDRYVLLREHFMLLADLICKHTPQSREQSLALTLLEQANMYSNAAIARNERE